MNEEKININFTVESLYSIRDTLGTAKSVLIKGFVLILGFMYIAGDMDCVLIKRDVPSFLFMYLASFAMRKSFLMATQRGSQAPKWSNTVTPMNATTIRTAPKKNNKEKEAYSE